jgi:phage terminase large subunit-like protein
MQDTQTTTTAQEARLPISPKKAASATALDLRHAEITHHYAKEITRGSIPACAWVKLACGRHLADLERQRSAEYPYRFDPRLAGRACRFIEELPHVRGQWARAPVGGTDRLRLEPWQVFIVANLFGWVEKRNALRRFREAMVLVPRKNGKSTLAAGIGLYMLCMDGEYGAEIYSGATTERQAMEVFRSAWQMARKTPDLEQYFGVKDAVKSLFIPDDGSRFQPMVGDPGDGSSPSCAIIDEYHEHPTSSLLDTMATGMGARQQPLLFVISTAGSSIEGPCHTMQRECEMMLEGRIENERRFAIIFTIDKGDDWKSKSALQKANPNYGVSVSESFLLEAQSAAIQSSHKQNVFRTKHLDIWVNAAAGWMNMTAWDACANPALTLKGFEKQACFEGVDLAAKIDLASRCKVFPRIENGAMHYYVFARHYVPMDRVQDGEHEHYARWVADGSLEAIPGSEIQLPIIQKEIEEEIPLFNRKCIAFDPWSALQMQQDLAAKMGEDTIVSIPQTTQYLSEAMKEVEAAVLSGRFHHDGDPVLSWAISCVIARPDFNDNIFPRKEKNGISKIDPASALFNGISRAMLNKPKATSIYTTRGLIRL